MTLLQSGLAKSLATADYTIDNSLRFNNDDTSYLSFTPSSEGNKKTWTFSCWTKFTTGAEVTLLGAGTSPNQLQYYVKSTGELYFWYQPGPNVMPTARLRDPSAWYHIVLAVDTTQTTAADRVKFYVNGEQLTDITTTTYPAQNLDTPVGDNVVHRIGIAPNASSQPYDGYMAEVYMINGTQLTPSSFGELDSDTNQWIPKDAKDDLTFGTNGFYQKYSSTELADSFEDSSAGIDTFTSIGTTSWTAPAGVTSVEYLVVAGGGGGGINRGGGGGGGGYLTGTHTVVPGNSYTVTVGDGGAGSSSDQGDDGDDSVFSSITATGGGGGGYSAGTPNGRAGGSGGGGGGISSGGAGTAGQGNAGGGGDDNESSGGGGGANAAGVAGSGSTAGAGGAGTASSITGSSVTYAGGGGGGTYRGTAGSGGAGGGGNGGGTGMGSGVGSPGTDGLGGGGGGAGYGVSGGNGGNGGSGIVIIKYQPGTGFHTITAHGGVTNTRAVRKIGDSSIKFDGTEDFLRSVDSVDWDFISSGTTDYTVEFWIQLSDHSGYNELISQGALPATASPDENLWTLTHSNGTGLAFKAFVSNTGIIATAASGEITDNDWHHIAVVRETNDYTVYLDGTGGTTLTDSSTTTFDGPLQINGRAQDDGTSAYEFNGYLDEIRISNSARYTGNFTPSTTAFTADANTLLLIHSNWTGGLGADSSGNYNTFTPTNLVATDQMTGESPTNNFATWNPVFRDSDNSTTSSYTEGNLKWASSGGDGWAKGTVGASSGKWYWEFYVNSISGTNGYFGAVDSDGAGQSPAMYYSSSAGSIASTGETTQTGLATVTAGDIVGIAIDLDASPQTGKVYKNNVQLGTTIDLQSGNTWTPFVLNANSGVSKTFTLNCGQDSSFAGAATAQGNQDGNNKGDFYYEPPSGYLALCTDNLSDPEIALPGENFNTVLYTGTDTAAGRAITGVGFQPDFVWSKARSITFNHLVEDVVRGSNKTLRPDETSAQDTDHIAGYLTSFDSDGYTTVAGTTNNSRYNQTGVTYVSWNWKAGGAPTATNSAGAGNTPTAGSVKIDGSNLGSALAGTIAATKLSANTTAGFSVVGFTGTGVAGTIAHGLSQAIDLVIVKNRTTGTTDWQTASSQLTDWDYRLKLNDTVAQAEVTSSFPGTAPTASVFSIGTNGDVNESGSAMIAYCFHSVEGYSKVGSYTGNGDTGGNGPFAYTGFSPAYVLIKRVDGAGSWAILNNKSPGYNVVNNSLYASDSNAETVGAGVTSSIVDFLSNGIKIRGYSGNVNTSSGTYTYLAFAESPFKTSNAR